MTLVKRIWVRLFIALLGIAAILSVVIAIWTSVRESWYIADLESEDDATRRRAVEALGTMGSRRAIAPLVRMLRASAIAAARNTAKEGSVRGRFEPEIVEALDRIGTSSIPSLIEGIRRSFREYEEVRRTRSTSATRRCYGESIFQRAALEILRRFGEPALPPLRQLLGEEPNSWVAIALASFGRPGRSVLIDVARHHERHDVRRTAAIALSLVRDDATIEATLTAALDDEEASVREAAEEGLARLRGR